MTNPSQNFKELILKVQPANKSTTRKHLAAIGIHGHFDGTQSLPNSNRYNNKIMQFYYIIGGVHYDGKD